MMYEFETCFNYDDAATSSTMDSTGVSGSALYHDPSVSDWEASVGLVSCTWALNENIPLTHCHNRFLL